MEELVGLLDTTYFRTGLRLGLVALVIGWILSLALGRKRPPLPMGGVLIAAAAVGGLYLVAEPLDSALTGLGLILAGSLVTRFSSIPRWVQPLAVLPGAVWIAAGTPVTELGWVRVLMAILIPLGGYLIADFEMRYDRLGLGVIFFTLAVFGVFASVPDTEEALLLVALVIPISLLAWPKVRVSLGPEGAYLAVAMFMWVIAAGGGGRPGSIVGATATLGLLLLEPLTVAFKPFAAQAMTWVTERFAASVMASLPQLFVVVLTSRVAARFEQEWAALVAVIVVYTVTITAAWMVVARGLDTRQSPS